MNGSADIKRIPVQSADDSHLVRLNQIELIVGIIVALLAVAGAIGSWYVLPYRVGELEKALSEIRVELRSATAGAAENRELLVRMDERMKSVQRALKISEQKP